MSQATPDEGYVSRNSNFGSDESAGGAITRRRRRLSTDPGLNVTKPSLELLLEASHSIEVGNNLAQNLKPVNM